uniref:Uncharacterized protein n=1 Tax=Cacopsylla melanoneura TaxID=428564 RepID=A0A8D8Q7I3_9HEMI
MMKIALLGLVIVIASVVDLSKAQSVPWTDEDAGYTQKFAGLNLPNPVCAANGDCDKLKSVVASIANAKHPGNSMISHNCQCLPTNGGPNGCSCTYNFNSKLGAHQAYEENVWNAGGIKAQCRTLPL